MDNSNLEKLTGWGGKIFTFNNKKIYSSVIRKSTLQVQSIMGEGGCQNMILLNKLYIVSQKIDDVFYERFQS